MATKTYNTIKTEIATNKEEFKAPKTKGGVLTPLPDTIEDLYEKLNNLNERLNNLETK